MNQKILIVDDDYKLVSAVQVFLEKSDFTVVSTGYASEVEDIVTNEAPSLILLDVMLPDGSGLDVANQLRGSGSAIPILFISALSKTQNVVAGLRSGGDDYLRKPFDPQELLEKIRAMIRRVSIDQQRDATVEQDVVLFGSNRFDLRSHVLMRNGVEISLAPADSELLQVFLSSPNRVLSRNHLVDRIHDLDRDVLDRSVDARINRLRKKIEDDPANPLFLKTVRGFGYRFDSD